MFPKNIHFSNRKVAVFDLDDTIIVGTAGLMLADELYKQKTFRNWGYFTQKCRMLKDTGISLDCKIQELSVAFAGCISGVSWNSMKKAISGLRYKIKVQPGFPQLYRLLKKYEFQIYLLTGSPTEATTPITEIYSFDGVFGLELEKNFGRYTGRCGVL